MRRNLVNSIGINILVAVITGVLVSNLHAINHHTVPTFSNLNADFQQSRPRDGGEDVTNSPTTQPPTLQPSQQPVPLTIAPIMNAPITNAPTTTKTTTKTTKRTVPNRIDLSCPGGDQLMVAPKVNSLLGMGHRLTESFYVLRYALVNGHCFCFPVASFGKDLEVYRLLLQPVIPECSNTTRLHQTSIKILDKVTNIKALARENRHSTVEWIYPEMGQVWDAAGQKRRPRGHGDVLTFMDHFVNDNHLMEDIMYPWYQEQKTIPSPFHQKNVTADDETIIRASLHMRVGDLIMDASEDFWRNVLKALRDVVDLEKGPNLKIEVYWLYFKVTHIGTRGIAERNKLSRNVIGEWPSEKKMLPETHLFIESLCQEFENMECYWKSGTNMLETIDLFVESDVVYVSGSSLAQVLSLFNRGGIKLISLPKELNFHGGVGKGTIPFLQTSTGGFTSLRYYYIDGSGSLFDEHQTYLRPMGSSKQLIEKNK